MKSLRCFLRRLTAFARTRRDEERLSIEIEEHLAAQTAVNIRAGLSPAEARRQAVLKFGGIEAASEACRDQRGLPFLESLLRDIRHSLRSLLHAPAFTFTTVLTLALGIGATTSIFTLAHALLLKSLPVANPDQLYRLGKQSRCCFYGASFAQKAEFSLVSYELYKQFRDRTPGFEQLAAFGAGEQMFAIRRAGFSDVAQAYPSEYVSGNYFSMFGLHAWTGRAFADADDLPAAPPVAMMSYRLWQRKYASDPTVVGSVFTLAGKPYTIIGITPPGFFGDQLRAVPPDFYLPLHTADPGDLNPPNLFWLDVIGRIRPGTNPASVEVQMRLELKQWLQSHWGEMTARDRAAFPSQTLFLVPGGAGISFMRELYGHWLEILLAASAFVLLIACANVASLMLVRGMERRRQTSMSMALGARAGRVIRQALTESILLALCGGAAGLAIAFAGTRLILYFAFPPHAGYATMPIAAAPSLPILLFAVAVSLTTGILFGIAPAWFASRLDPIEALRGVGRSTTRTGSLPRKSLIVLQTALSLTLLSAAGLLTATLWNLQHRDFGFEQDRRLIVTADPGVAGYKPEQLEPLYTRIHDTLSAIPAVSAVALCIYSPMEGNVWNEAIVPDGHPAPEPDNLAGFDRVTPGYFDVIGSPILRGRSITERDTDTARHVAVVSEAFARQFFPNEDALGKHFGQFGPSSARDYEIVGIVRDAQYFNFDADHPSGPIFFLPSAQHDRSTDQSHADFNQGSHFLRNIVIALRPGAPAPIAAVHQAMASIDPNMPVLEITTMRDQVAGNFTQQRLIARLTSLFGLLSLILASIGLYGVTAYNAGQRTAEIGVRMAVGADRGSTIALILRGAFFLIVVGLILGVPLAFAAGRFLGHQLYGMSPYSPAVTLTAVAVLMLSALIASLLPAFRASLISPLEALRAE